MSPFIGALVVPEAPSPKSGTKIGILLGSAVAALFGSIVLSLSPKPGWAEATSEDRLG
jgi:Na+/H+ antiporter NhaA